MGGVFYTVRSFDDWVNMVGRIRSIAVCVLVLLFALSPAAYALPGPVVVESDGWNSNYTALCAETSQDRATAAFCGIDWDEQLNSAQRTYLSSDADWTAFRNAVHLSDNPGADFFAFPIFSGAALDARIYVVDVDGSVYAKAKKVLEQVMSGVVGNTPDIGDDWVTYSGQCWLTTNSSAWTSGTDGLSYQQSVNPSAGRVPLPGTASFAITSALYNQARSLVSDDGYDLFIIVTLMSSNDTYYTIVVAPSDSYSVDYAEDATHFRKISKITWTKSVQYFHISTSYDTVTFDGSTFFCAGNPSLRTLTSTAGRSMISNPNIAYTGTVVHIPTTPDPTPQPPVQPPDPGTDVPTVDPPTWPTIDFPDITIHGAPITITWPTIADNADYTELLKQIIKRLEKIGDVCTDILNDMADHCEHLEQAIQDAAEYIVDNLELGIDPDLDDLVRGIDNAWRKITQTIKEQVKWLADQLDYDFTVTLDLDKIEQYLRRIISKMGGGTSKPDPTTDPFSWGDWLDDLWKKIFTALQIALPDELGQLLELFDILKTKFPFSVPFDLIAIVALFDHAPVTPVFDLPYPMLLATGVGYDTVTIDCSGWNSTMVMVRDLEVVLFTAYLISRTQWAMDSINPKKGK